MIFYSFDAFFNFPSDRTEIQSLFAFFIAIGIVSSDYKMLNFQFPGKYIMLIRGITMLFIFSSIYFLYQNFISLRYQELAAREIQENFEIYKRNDFNMRFKTPANYFIQGFPAFPDLGTKGEPIDIYKARYLIYEKRYQEAIDLLKNNHASPFNPRKEYFVALAYFKLGNMDSALVYANQVKLMKPKNFMTYGILHEIYAARGDMKSASGQFEEYLRISRKNNLAWNNLSIDFERMGDLNKALAVLDSGLTYLPGDTLLLSSRAYINKRLQTYPYEDLYARAVQYFEKQDYLKATACFSDFLNKKPGFIDAYAYRGMCFYNQKKYLEGARDLDTYLEKDSLNNKMYNIRGICYLKLGQNNKACNDFLKGMNGGDQDAKSNYSKFCSKKP